MQTEYAAAKSKFPAIVLYDISSTSLKFADLPQLVIYPATKGGTPTIVKGTDAVAKQLQRVVRGEGNAVEQSR